MGFVLTLLYVTMTYLRPMEFFPELAEYRILFWLGAAVALAASVDVFLGSVDWLRRPQTYLVLAFWMWTGISVAMQGWAGGAPAAWGQFSVAAFCFYSIAVTATSLRRLMILSGTLVLCTVILAGQGVAAYHYGWNDEALVLNQNNDLDEDDDVSSESADTTLRRIRSVGFLNDPNDFAQVLLLALPLLGIFWNCGTGIRVALGLAAMVLLYATYLTFSRGALLALGVLVFFWLKARMGTVAASAWLAPAVMAAGALATMQGRSISATEDSSAGRLAAWSEGLMMLREHPISGVGFGAFTDYNELTAHNSIVLCFAELGLVGLVLWIAVILSSSRGSTLVGMGSLGDERAYDVLEKSLRAALIAFLASAFFLSRTYSPSLFVLLGMLTALGSLAGNRAVPIRFGSLMSKSLGLAVASTICIQIIVIASRFS